MYLFFVKIFNKRNNYLLKLKYVIQLNGDWGLGIGDWGLGKIGRAHV